MGGLFDERQPGSLIVLWHNRLFPGIGALFQGLMKDRRLYALVSARRDGGQFTHYLEAQGIIPIRGSSSRRGAVAARELLKVLQQGHHVAITVDGPRGPRYQAQPGVALLAQLTGAPIALVGIEAEACWELKSWDRFILPKPFSRVRLTVEHHMPIMDGGARERREATLRLIQRRLVSLNQDFHQKE